MSIFAHHYMYLHHPGAEFALKKGGRGMSRRGLKPSVA